MDALEVSIWSAMTGALLLLCITAATDVLARRSRATWRGLAFVLLSSASAVLMTGLPEHLLGISNARSLLPAKAALGPLASALALTYLGRWLGLVVEDWLIRVVVSWGSLWLVMASALLALWAWLDTGRPAYDILLVSAVVNLASGVFAAVVAVRGATLGDPLASRVAWASVFLVGLMLGLYAKGMGFEGLGPAVWATTALCCVAYFLVVTMLTMERNKTLHKLKRLARGQQATDAVTGLPTGVELMVQVDDALWRSARAKRQTMTIAVWVANLYELSGVAGLSSDLEIRTALAARMRRAVGFRNVVGQYHPRCFVVVVSAVQNERVLRIGIERLRSYLTPSLHFGALSHDDFVFKPQIGFGVVMSAGDATAPNSLLDEAEQLAQTALQMPGQVAIRRPGQSKATSLQDEDEAWQKLQREMIHSRANSRAQVHGNNRPPEHARAYAPEWPETVP
jgi:GGDEF domain-containing protein